MTIVINTIIITITAITGNIKKTKPNAAAAASSGIDQQGKKITVFQDGYKNKINCFRQTA